MGVSDSDPGGRHAGRRARVEASRTEWAAHAGPAWDGLAAGASFGWNSMMDSPSPERRGGQGVRTPNTECSRRKSPPAKVAVGLDLHSIGTAGFEPATP